MNWQPRNTTLVIISILSLAGLLSAVTIAGPIAVVAGNIVDHFWGGLDPATIWRGAEAMGYVFHAVSWLVILISLACGALAWHELYKRYKAGTASKRQFIYPSILFGLSIVLVLFGYVYLPLTAGW